MHLILCTHFLSAFILAVDGSLPGSSGYYPYNNPQYDVSNIRRGSSGFFVPPPRRSYIIYEGDVGKENIPQTFSGTRSWHLQFNQINEARRNPPQNAVAYQTVSSNLLQVVDEPYQRKYFGPFNGKAYLDNSKRYPDYIKPLDVPKYDVIYPYNDQRETIYQTTKLPDKFPAPFSPNVNFAFRDPPPVDRPRQDFGFYQTQTVNYSPDMSASRRAGAKELCNYIRLNDKGFPAGNEMCGRTISDILLSEEYPTTGQLVLEHRKRYRGEFPTTESLRSLNSVSRQKRNSDNYQSSDNYRSYDGSYGISSYPTGSCCFGNRGYFYGYKDYDDRQNNNGYGNVHSTDQGYWDSGRYNGYGYRQLEGQMYDSVQDNFRGDTSNSQLTSYLTNRGKNRDNYDNSDESNESDDDDYKQKNRSNGSNSSGKDRKSGNNAPSGKNSRSSSNSTSSDRHRNEGRNSKRRNNERRGNNGDNYDSEYSGRSGSNSRGDGNGYGTYDNRGGYGSSSGYGSSNYGRNYDMDRSSGYYPNRSGNFDRYGGDGRSWYGGNDSGSSNRRMWF